MTKMEFLIKSCCVQCCLTDLWQLFVKASERFASILLGRVDDIFGVEFLGRNLSLSVHCISMPHK